MLNTPTQPPPSRGRSLFQQHCPLPPFEKGGKRYLRIRPYAECCQEAGYRGSYERDKRRRADSALLAVGLPICSCPSAGYGSCRFSRQRVGSMIAEKLFEQLAMIGERPSNLRPQRRVSMPLRLGWCSLTS